VGPPPFFHAIALLLPENFLSSPFLPLDSLDNPNSCFSDACVTNVSGRGALCVTIYAAHGSADRTLLLPFSTSPVHLPLSVFTLFFPGRNSWPFQGNFSRKLKRRPGGRVISILYWFSHDLCPPSAEVPWEIVYFHSLCDPNKRHRVRPGFSPTPPFPSNLSAQNPLLGPSTMSSVAFTPPPPMVTMKDSPESLEGRFPLPKRTQICNLSRRPPGPLTLIDPSSSPLKTICFNLLFSDLFIMFSCVFVWSGHC